MNPGARNAKIKKYIEILEKYCCQDFVSMESLKGKIWSDQEKKEILEPVQEGKAFGGARKSFCLLGEFKAEQKKACDSVLMLELGHSKSLEALAFLYGPEAIIFIDGTAVSGMDPNHSSLILDKKYLDGKRHTIRLDGWTGIKEEIYEVGKIGICYQNRKCKRFARLCRICFETAENTNDEHMYSFLIDSLNVLNLYEPLGTEFEKSVSRAYNSLTENLNNCLNGTDMCAAACGHGHLDLAWLWRTSQAKKKGARTFLNVLELMERHPEFKYSQTQAQLYQWIEEEYPSIFEKVQKAVADEKWEIIGGMWVEPDCNLTGAEAMVRQFLLFNQYIKEKFGTKGSPVVWLPDTFGFCGQLPQIMKDAGYSYFSTAKLTWNQYNKMPSEYFWWEGIDGSRVLSYIVSTSKPGWWGATYSADLTPEELISTIQEQEAQELHNEILVAYGMGDGGGGPTEEMVSRGELMKKYQIRGLPNVRFSTFQSFFEKLEENVAKNLPVWNGELYFELHRGTYTSQAEVKKNNRLCEATLHKAEFLAVFAAEETEYKYPTKCFKKLWEIVCMNQFHDILPGSSIREVYEDAKKDHELVLKECQKISKEAVKALEVKMPEKADMVIVNSTSYLQNDIIQLPFAISERQAVVIDGTICKSASCEGKTYVQVENVLPYGYLTLSIEEQEDNMEYEETLFAGAKLDLPEEYDVLEAAKYILFNDVIWIELDADGDIICFRDRAEEREIAKPLEKFLQWKMYEDRPADWDAWDLDEDYNVKGYRKAELYSIESFYIPGLKAGFRMEKRIGRSFIIQEISIETGEKDLKVSIHLDYKESNQHLRMECPVQIHNSYAEYGTQFGSVIRNTHYNTSWDKAKFETCMHKWADYSEGNYGVAIICDNKYGISIHEEVISLAVSKSASFPDPFADRGRQEFTFILCPHRNKEREAIMRKAYLLNNPLEVFKVEGGKGKEISKSMVSSDSENVVIETVKQSEDGSGVIIRAYECNNTRGKVRFSYKNKLQEACRCSVLEEKKELLLVDENRIEKEYRPYEIMTIRVQGGKDESVSNAKRSSNSI